jgi:DNA invertase Pin-like site-specific DNA recombinase
MEGDRVSARAYIYTRPERNKKGEMVDDNAMQVERCEEYARMHGYRVSKVLQEDDHGPEDERPELKQLRGAIWRQQVDVLIAPKPETLYRDTNRLVRLARELAMINARLEFVDVDINDYAFEEDEY